MPAEASTKTIGAEAVKVTMMRRRISLMMKRFECFSKPICFFFSKKNKKTSERRYNLRRRRSLRNYEHYFDFKKDPEDEEEEDEDDDRMIVSRRPSLRSRLRRHIQPPPRYTARSPPKGVRRSSRLDNTHTHRPVCKMIQSLRTSVEEQ